MSPHAPEAVADILMDIPDTDNPFIVHDFLEAAIAMPTAIAAKLTARIGKLIKTPFFNQGQLAGKLATHLARGGEHTAALTVLRAALEVIPDPRPIPEELKQFDPEYKYEARARIRDYEYELILQRHTIELTHLLGLPFLSLLCGLLGRALKLEMRSAPASGRIEDYSYIWRPSIRTGERSDSVKNVLASAVLSSADCLCTESPNLLDNIGEVLTAKRFKLFERIEFEVITRHHEVAASVIARKLTDRKLFDDVGVRAEYYALAEKAYSSLKESEQGQILQWIDDGLDRKLLQERGGLSTEQAEERIEYWRLERLAPIREHLPALWRNRYAALEQRFGTPPLSAHPVVRGGVSPCPR